jgi:hypothetical protein
VSEADTALAPTRTPEPEARCGTRFTAHGRPTRCDFYLIRTPEGGWTHTTDRCESCVFGLPPGQVCEWHGHHDHGPRCDAPAPRVCAVCETPLDPELELNGHPLCDGEPGECCGACCWGADSGPDPDDHYEIQRDAALGL